MKGLCMSTQAPPAPAAETSPETPFEPRLPPPPAAAPPPPGTAPAATDSPRPRRRRRWRFGIQSKLLIMLLVTSICSALVVGIVGYQSGKNSLQDAAFNQLTQVRESRAREINSFFDQLKNSMVLYTRGATAIQAVQGFTAGFDALESAAITPAQNQALTAYYQDVFISGLESNTGNTSDPAGF